MIESSRPRALAQLGVDAAALVAERSDLVWVSVTAYGRGDPEGGWIGFGDDAGAAAGLAAETGDPGAPLFCGDAIADPLTGLHAAVATLAHLRAGRGALLELALRDVAAHVLAFDAPAGGARVAAEGDACEVAIGAERAARRGAALRARRRRRAAARRGHRRRSSPSVLIRGAEVDGARRDVRIAEGRICEIADALPARAGEPRFDAAGGALLPGLHDHHIHLLALAASLASVACGPPAVRDRAELGAALRARAGATSRAASATTSRSRARSTAPRSMRWLPTGRVRIQHRSGALWMLNSRAIERLGLDRDAGAPGVERDAAGRSNGRPLPRRRVAARAARGRRRCPTSRRSGGSCRAAVSPA